MIAALLLGISYGFTAGVSPGPLLGLVITQTLQRGWRAGNFIALAPLFSDLPIVLLMVFLLSHVPSVAFGWLGIVGGLFVIYLGIETIRGAWKQQDQKQEKEQIGEYASGNSYAVLGRAVVTNMLNPHPYLFWGTVGAQLLIRTAQSSGLAGATTFLVGFYALLVGSKLLIVLLVSRSRNWLRGRTYQGILIASGVLLFGLGVLLISEGVSTLFYSTLSH